MKRLYDASRPSAEPDKCELCAAPIATTHDHLYEPKAREVHCVCQGCNTILPTAAGSPYRRVPKRRTTVALDAAAWLATLGVPVGVAAVMLRDGNLPVAAYPGPAGTVETDLDAKTWIDLRTSISMLTPEVESLVLVNLPEVKGAWIVGIDVVFRMSAELRHRWEGITGGQHVHEAVATALELEAKALQ